MIDLSTEELEKILESRRKEYSKQKKKMKTSKKALFAYFVSCAILVSFTMAMIYLGKDSSALNTLAEAGLKGLPLVYGIYQANSYLINKKHMEENYIPDYDDKMGIY